METFFEKAIRRGIDATRGRNSAVSLIRLAELDSRSQKWAAAAAKYASAKRLWPRYAPLTLAYGEALRQSGRTVEALAALEALAEQLVEQRRKANGHATPAVDTLLVQTYRAIAEAAAAMGRMRDAEAALERALAIEPDAADTKVRLQFIRDGLGASGVVYHEPGPVRIPKSEPGQSQMIAIRDLLEASPSLRARTNLDSSFFAKALPLDCVEDRYHQCACYSQALQPIMDGDGTPILCCETCGTQFSPMVTFLNSRPVSVRTPLATIGAADLQSLFTKLGITVPASARVGFVAAQMVDGTDRFVTVPATSDGMQTGDLDRVSFDVVVVPGLGDCFSDPRTVIDVATRALRPNGLLIVGYTTPLATPLGQAGKAYQAWESLPKSLCARDLPKGSKRLIDLSPTLMMKMLRPLDNKWSVVGAYRQDRHHLIVVRKSGELTAGVMSGIGDSVWSFVLARSVMRKLGADRLVLMVHDSGDHRRKRSNSMLTRFKFVDDVLPARFDVHANPPMNDTTGHINYHPSGPAHVASTDPFDYRLIFNTYLEHGYTYDQICAEMDLDPADTDFDFWKDYRELPEDLAGLDRLRSILGERYIVVHFGAKLDNSEAGLNRGPLWKPEDWISLCDKLHARYGCKIAVIGASYDLEFAKEVLAKTRDDYFVNTIGQLDLPETLALIQRAQFMVSFPSGVGIVGPYMNVPTVIFWRPKNLAYHPMHDRSGFEKGFAVNWVPPRVLAAGRYIDAWYTVDTPESLDRKIHAAGWFKP